MTKDKLWLLDFGDFIKKIREQEAMMDETNWDNVFNEIVDTYYVNPQKENNS